jgi:type II secretory ATPase GspE/PulE/Tfp pilus assembly ATPase PilB-like protein
MLPQSADDTRPSQMTEKDLALTLIHMERLTPQQLHEAAHLRQPGKNLAHILIDLGWLSREELRQLNNSAAKTSNGNSHQPDQGGPYNQGSTELVLIQAAPAVQQATQSLASKESAPPTSTFPFTLNTFNGKQKSSAPVAKVSVPNGADKQASSNGVAANSDPGPVEDTFLGLGYEEPPALESEEVLLDGDSAIDEDEIMSVTVRACNDILLRAVRMGASDVHLEPRTNGLLPRFRVDGHLRSSSLFPREVQAAIVSRLKVMANLNITETRLSKTDDFAPRLAAIVSISGFPPCPAFMAKKSCCACWITRRW